MTATSSFASLADQVILVTGASSGIGKAIALEAARAGAEVGIHYGHNRDRILKTQEEIEAIGGICRIFQCDLQVIDQHEKLINEVLDWRPNISGWVNNAGVDLLTGPHKTLGYLEKLELLYQIDVKGTVSLSRLIGTHFKEQGRGSIINIGWDQAERGMEGDSGELFATAKNAIMGFSRSLALSLAPKVRVNCIAPGWIRTAWGETAGQEWQQRVASETPLDRWGEPDDIAKLARFLLSQETAYITGQVLYANGGAER